MKWIHVVWTCNIFNLENFCAAQSKYCSYTLGGEICADNQYSSFNFEFRFLLVVLQSRSLRSEVWTYCRWYSHAKLWLCFTPLTWMLLTPGIATVTICPSDPEKPIRGQHNQHKHRTLRDSCRSAWGWLVPKEAWMYWSWCRPLPLSHCCQWSQPAPHFHSLWRVRWCSTRLTAQTMIYGLCLFPHLCWIPLLPPPGYFGLCWPQPCGGSALRSRQQTEHTAHVSETLICLSNTTQCISISTIIDINRRIYNAVTCDSVYPVTLPRSQTIVCCRCQRCWSQSPALLTDLETVPGLTDCRENTISTH